MLLALINRYMQGPHAAGVCPLANTSPLRSQIFWQSKNADSRRFIELSYAKRSWELENEALYWWHMHLTPQKLTMNLQSAPRSWWALTRTSDSILSNKGSTVGIIFLERERIFCTSPSITNNGKYDNCCNWVNIILNHVNLHSSLKEEVFGLHAFLVNGNHQWHTLAEIIPQKIRCNLCKFVAVLMWNFWNEAARCFQSLHVAADPFMNSIISSLLIWCRGVCLQSTSNRNRTVTHAWLSLFNLDSIHHCLIYNLYRAASGWLWRLA